MFGQDANILLTTLGLPTHGEMSIADLPAYLERLKTAVNSDKTANPVIWPEELNAEEDLNAPVVVRFSQRAVPMMQLMIRCISATEPISW